MIDKIKDFWNKRPCNIKHSKKEIGTYEYFEEVANKRYFVEPHIVFFMEPLEWKNKNVLEIGCGIGTDSMLFTKYLANLTAVDLSAASVKIAKERYELYGSIGYGLGKAEFYEANAEELSSVVPVKPYDLIYSFGVIHHAERPEKIIEQIKLYMNKDSELRIMLYSGLSFKAIDFFIRKGYKFGFNFNKTIQYYAEAQSDCPQAIVYNKKKIKELLKDFDIIEIKKDHIFTYSIPEYLEGKYVKTPLFKYMPNFIFNFLKKHLGWHYLIKAKLK